jgi:hypothetical protein
VASASIAARCCKIAIRLGLVDEARRWLAHIESDSWRVETRLRKLECQAELDLRSGDLLTLRETLKRMDEAADGTQSVARHLSRAELATCMLLLDESLGDPERPAHPVHLRLADLTQSDAAYPLMLDHRLRGFLQYRLASLRYAAGIPPEVDYFGLPSTSSPGAFAPRLPAELPVRLAGTREAWEEAAANGRRIDEVLESDRRHTELANLKASIDRIAAAHQQEPSG